MPIGTDEERNAAKAAIGKAKTKDEIVAAWKEHYLKVGHKALARMLIGTDQPQGK